MSSDAPNLSAANEGSQEHPRKQLHVTMNREAPGVYRATNARGGEVVFGMGEGMISPGEMLLAALAGCSTVDVEAMTTRRAEPEEFRVETTATKVDSRLQDIEVTFYLRFPEGTDGDAARARITTAIWASHEKECTVSRTIEAGTPITMRAADPNE